MDAKEMLAKAARRLRGRKPRAVRRAEGNYAKDLTGRHRTGTPDWHTVVQRTGRLRPGDIVAPVMSKPERDRHEALIANVKLPPTGEELATMTVPTLRALYFELTGAELPSKLRKADVLAAVEGLR